jgi:hypothetical protein
MRDFEALAEQPKIFKEAPPWFHQVPDLEKRLAIPNQDGELTRRAGRSQNLQGIPGEGQLNRGSSHLFCVRCMDAMSSNRSQVPRSVFHSLIER